MQPNRKQYRGDAFNRAIRETFGETTTFAKVEKPEGFMPATGPTIS